MKEDNDIINNLANEFSNSVFQQYTIYKNKTNELNKQYEQLKQESHQISTLISKMKNDNLINGHITKLFSFLQNTKLQRKRLEDEANIKKIANYFQKVQDLSTKSLKHIFEVRSFLTGQEFDLYIEERGKIFSFSIKDIEEHIGGITPAYTDSLEAMTRNMLKDSRAAAPQLTKLGLSLKSLDEDLELKEINPYLDFVEYHVTKNKLQVSDNRKLEAAIYLYGRNPSVDFGNQSDRHSMHVMLGWYMSKGGLKDNIVMYKLGDAIIKNNDKFKNIEIKMHNGIISLTMIANGIKKLNSAFNDVDPEKKMLSFFQVNKAKISSPIEKAASEEAIKAIKEKFQQLNINLTS